VKDKLDIQMLSMENVDKLVEFEERARISEWDIFLAGFDSEKFQSKTLPH